MSKPKRKKPELTKNETKMLDRIRRNGCLLVNTTFRPSKALLGLVAKNKVRILPGLLDETPQGYAISD